MPFFELPHMQMYYEVHGEGEPLVLIPGVTLDSGYWHDLLPLLKPKFQVIIIDLRDVGKTVCEAGDYTIGDMTNEVAQLLESLKLGPYNVAGFSMGGMISYELTKRHPSLVKTLSLIGFGLSTSGRTGWLLRTWVDMAEFLPRELGIREALLWMHADDFFKSASAVQEHVARVASLPAVQSLEQFRRQAAACGKWKPRPEQGGINCPTMILIGTDDKLFSLNEAKLLADSIASSQLRVIEKAGHHIILEQPEESAAALSEFCLSSTAVRT